MREFQSPGGGWSSCTAGRPAGGGLRMRSTAQMCKGKTSKENPSRIQIGPNLAKSSQAQPNPTKGKAWISFVQIEPYQGLARTPQGGFSFACPVRPHRLARVGPPHRPGAFLFHMHSSFNRVRLAALSFFEIYYTTDSENLQEVCRETAKTLGIPGVRGLGRSSAASSPDRRSGRDLLPPKTAKPIRSNGMAIRQMWRPIVTREFQPPAAGTFMSDGSAAADGQLRSGRERVSAADRTAV